MFGFNRGEKEETILRERTYRREAQKRWPFLTTYDLSTINTPEQLKAMVQTRLHVAKKIASDDVDDWSKDKEFAGG